MNRLLVLIAAFLFIVACAAPYMTASDCANFCHAEGKKVASYFLGAQIPIVHPRPSTKCLCEESATETP
jgi:hypothetical protein